jgi:FKBP-type peptidyl-prolyl cis-trans isomerase
MTRLRSLTVLCTACLVTVTACGGATADGTPSEDDITDVSLEPAEQPADEPADDDSAIPSDRPSVEPPAAQPTELVITDIRPGTGWTAAPGDTIWVDYTGIRSINGTEFDNSYDRGEPISFTLGANQVIDGWDEGLVGAQAGMQRRLDIPAELAYGDSPPGGVIEAGDALTFMLEVRAVVPPSVEADSPLDLTLTPYAQVLEPITDDLIVGEGDPVVDGDSVIVQIMMARGDNLVVVLNTWADNKPLLIEMVDGYTVPGLQAGLYGMRLGGRRVIAVPPEDAFGGEGIPSIGLPADTPVVFIVDLVGRF